MVGDAYLHEGTDKSRAVVLLHDAFGLALVNCKVIADELSKKLSCDVWVPDMFAGMFIHRSYDRGSYQFKLTGHPPVTVDELEPLIPDRAGVQMTFMSKLRFHLLLITRLTAFWRIRSSVVDPRGIEV